MSFDWMKKLTDETRSALALPMNLQTGTADWVAVSNGRLIVAVMGKSEDFSAAPPGAIADTIKQYLDLNLTKEQHITSTLDQIKAWCGKPTWGKDEPCWACKGKGTVKCRSCDGTAKAGAECENCSETHECVCMERDCEDGQVTCNACEGAKREGAKHVWRLGNFKETYIDLEWLAKGLDRIEGGPVIIAIRPKDQIILAGDMWRMVLMAVYLDELGTSTQGKDSVAFPEAQLQKGAA